MSATGFSAESAGADPAQVALQRACTAMFAIVEDASFVIAKQMIARVPLLGPIDDERAFESTRRSALGSMYELLCVTRAGLNTDTIETSPEALQHLRFLQHRGVGFRTVLSFYQIGFSMFEPLLLSQLSRFVPDRETLNQMAGPARQFIFNYVDQITRRLAVESGVERDGWSADASDPSWHDPESVAVIRAFIDQSAAAGPSEPSEGAAARRYTTAALEQFISTVEDCATDENLSLVLARANTTVYIELADDRDLGVTLLLDRQPIEIVRHGGDTEVMISICSVDLARLYSTDFHLPLAVLRGRVTYSGPVRKFLRIAPVLRSSSPSEVSTPSTVLS